MAMFPDRKSKALAILLSCIIAAVCFGTLYFVGNLARFQEGAVVRQDAKSPVPTSALGVGELEGRYREE